MILYLCFIIVLIIPSILTDCSNNKNYGNNCQENNIFIDQPPSYIASNCVVQIKTTTYAKSNIIFPIIYHVVYGQTEPVSPQDYSKWQSKTTMSCTSSTSCQADVTIPSEPYVLGIYFDFTDSRYNGSFQSMVSPSSTTTCNSCSNNKTYGPSCQYTCDYCSLGCDASGTCVNGTCFIGLYGAGCKTQNVIINEAPTFNITNCLVRVSSVTYTSSNNLIGASKYYVVYGPSTADASQDFAKWPSRITMNCYAKNCLGDFAIISGLYNFGVYFDFIDIRYSDQIQSLVFPVVNISCNGSSTPLVVITTSISTASIGTIPITNTASKTSTEPTTRASTTSIELRTNTTSSEFKKNNTLELNITTKAPAERLSAKSAASILILIEGIDTLWLIILGIWTSSLTWASI